MKVLIIDDDKDLALSLKSALLPHYSIELAHTLEEGEYYIGLHCFDVIVLDPALPNESGTALCRRLRHRKCPTPILVISSECSLEKKIAAFEDGVDDYLEKPFQMREFLVRVKALLRRSREQVSEKIFLDDLIIDVSAKTVRRCNNAIALRRKEYLILEYLLRNVGRVMTRESILNHVWGLTEEISGNVVDVHIKYLRDRVDRQFDKKLIKTVHGLGYKIEG
jgi:DNA-binding response OmpR family regulator